MDPETQEKPAALLGIEPDELLEPQLRHARLGGYAEEDVSELLERCRLEIATGRSEITRLRETVHVLQQQPQGAHASLNPTTGVRVLAKAQETADQLVVTARQQAEQILGEAREQAQALTAETAAKAQAVLREAGEEATAEANRIKAQAPRDAEQRAARYLALAETIKTQMDGLVATWAEQTAAAAEPAPANGRARRPRSAKPAAGPAATAGR